MYKGAWNDLPRRKRVGKKHRVNGNKKEGPAPEGYSKYNQKVRARKAGTLKPFEFKDKRGDPVRDSSAAARPLIQRPAPPKKAPVAPPAITAKQKVRATVTGVRPGCVFLTTADNVSVFLPNNVLHRDYTESDVTLGYVMECEIGPGPSGKGPRVTRILSVSPVPPRS